MTKRIMFGITGGIAVYKAADLCSRLTMAGYDVHVIMTQAACQLISERVFLTLSRNPVITDLWSTPEWKPVHIEISSCADLMLVAPCTANFLGKYANGIADDALTTAALAYTGPVLLAPAMNSRMWAHPAVQHNCEILHLRGVNMVGPGSGHLACGENGVGRMAEAAEIFEQVQTFLKQ